MKGIEKNEHKVAVDSLVITVNESPLVCFPVPLSGRGPRETRREQTTTGCAPTLGPGYDM